MKKRSILFLVFCITNSLLADVSISFVKNGTTQVEVRISNTNFDVEIQYDTSLKFNSNLYGSKHSRSKLIDTIKGLKFGCKYYFRARQITNNGFIASNWYNTSYNTANYPFSQYITSGNPINYVTSPTHQYSYPYYPTAELWYDTSPNFNSSKLVKTQWNNDRKTINIPLYKNHDTLYIRSRVIDKNDSLPWKSTILVTKFKTRFDMNWDNPCSDTSIFGLVITRTVSTTFPTVSSKFYIVSQNNIDSTESSFYNLTVNNNDPISIISHVKYTDGTISDQFIDTTIFVDPINLNVPLSYYLSSTPTNSIVFNPNGCNTGIELELHSDTFYNSLISSQYFNTKSSSYIVSFNTDWNEFKGTALRYRKIRAGVKGKWINISNEYVPLISYTEEIPGDDTSKSAWRIKRSNPQIGKKLEVELDINSEFNSSKKKRFTINDSSSFILESLFGRSNFVRCRLTDGSYKGKWSNTVFKYFSNEFGYVNAIFTQPKWTCAPSRTFVYSGLEMKFGHTKNPSNMKYRVYDSNIGIPDTFDFVAGDTVYFQLRRFTPIDTSNWSKTFQSTYTGNNSMCFIPKITYNGVSNGLDTFHIKWLDKNPAYSDGVQIVFGPGIGQYKAVIEVPKGISSYIINRSQFPANWAFAIYPVCKFPKTYSTLNADWYSLNGNKLDLWSEQTQFNQVFYNSEFNTIVNSSDSEYDFRIFDISGKTIQIGKLNALESVELNHMSQGIYFLSLTNSYNSTHTLTFLIP